VPGSDPAFTTTGAIAGVTFFATANVPERRLTNGVTLAGPAFSRADVFLNETSIAAFAAALCPTRDSSLCFTSTFRADDVRQNEADVLRASRAD
jgi:hypothetical protein